MVTVEKTPYGSYYYYFVVAQLYLLPIEPNTLAKAWILYNLSLYTPAGTVLK